MAHFSRAAWGARPPKANPSGWPLGQPTSATCHWTGGHVPDRSSGNYSDIIRAIQNQHHNSPEGYADIAYNFGVDKFGNTYELRGRGFRSGAQGPGNPVSLAILVLTSPGGAPFTAAAKNAVLGLAGGLPLRTHSSWNSTACPGPDVTAWVRSGAPGGPAQPAPTPAPKPPPPSTNTGDIEMAGILSDGLTHGFYIRENDARFVENYGKPGNPRKINDSIFPASWRFATGDRARVTVIDHAPGHNGAFGYTVLALREDGKHENVAEWHGAAKGGWKTHGAPS